MAIKNPLFFAGGCVAGAVGMYYADPHRGAYRRALLKDKGAHYRKVLFKKSGVASRDFTHRARGVISNARARLFPEPVPDDILVARVASKIGRVVANPHSLGVTADRGRVILTGPVFNDEAEPLFHVVRKIQGVRSVESHLETHSRSERFPGLQGHRRHRPARTGLEFIPTGWTPALRMIISLAGGIAALSGSLAALRRSA